MNNELVSVKGYWSDLDSANKKDKWRAKGSLAVALTDKKTDVVLSKLLDPKKQGEACRKLFASVMTLAIQDSTKRPVKDRSFNKLTICNDARSAMAFLFSDRCDVYLHFLDIQPKTFRKSLVECMSGAKNSSEDSVFCKLISPMARRSFMFNYRHYENIVVPDTYDFECETNA